jgi:hypothetical protein
MIKISYKHDIIALGLVVILGSLVYANSLLNSFVFDDAEVVVKTDLIRSWKYLPLLFSPDYFVVSGEKSYRPLVTLSYFLDYALWKFNPWGFHLHNIILQRFYLTISDQHCGHRYFSLFILYKRNRSMP